MADQKISELTALTGANVADDDAIAIVDTSATETKKIVFSELKNALDTATGFVRITGDTMTGALDVQSTITADGLTVDGDGTFSATNPTVDIKATNGNDASLILMETTGNDFGANGANGFRSRYDGGDNALYIQSGAETTIRNRIKVDRDTGDISFYDSAGSSQSFYWDASAESLGIGTTSPDGNLTVGSTTTSGDISIRIKGDATSRGFLMFGDAGGAQLGDIMYDHSDNHMRFRVNNAERMYITSTGNVGIGVVPDAWSGTGAAIQLEGTGHLATANQYAYIGSNYYYNAGWKYTTSSTAAQYRQDSGSHQWLNAASGTADAALTWSPAMTLDASGNLLVGTTDSTPIGSGGTAITPDGRIDVSRNGGLAAQFERRTSDGDIVSFIKDGSSVGSIGASNGDLTIGTTDVAVRFSDSSNQIYPINITTRAAVDGATILGNPAARFKDLHLSGDVYVNTDPSVAYPKNGHYLRGSDSAVFSRDSTGETMQVRRNTTDGNFIRFYKGASTIVGDISLSGSSTAYNTSSDYRLKTDAQPMTGATDRLKQLNPVNFEWIADGTRVDGFLAHEAQAVVPEAVTGTKDAMRDEEYEVTPAVLDDDGNVVTEAVMGTRSVPDYQGIDQSKMVPLLVATIHELEARITALENA